MKNIFGSKRGVVGNISSFYTWYNKLMILLKCLFLFSFVVEAKYCGILTRILIENTCVFQPADYLLFPTSTSTE